MPLQMNAEAFFFGNAGVGQMENNFHAVWPLMHGREEIKSMVCSNATGRRCSAAEAGGPGPESRRLTDEIWRQRCVFRRITAIK